MLVGREEPVPRGAGSRFNFCCPRRRETRCRPGCRSKHCTCGLPSARPWKQRGPSKSTAESPGPGGPGVRPGEGAGQGAAFVTNQLDSKYRPVDVSTAGLMSRAVPAGPGRVLAIGARGAPRDPGVHGVGDTDARPAVLPLPAGLQPQLLMVRTHWVMPVALGVQNPPLLLCVLDGPSQARTTLLSTLCPRSVELERSVWVCHLLAG